jgi:hypothetical protein
MPLYMYQAAYTAESVAAQIKGAAGSPGVGQTIIRGHGSQDPGRRLPTRRI